MTKQPFIVFTPPNDYKRYLGAQCTDHVQSENRSLTVQELELLRTDPMAFYTGANEPDTA